MVMRREKKCGRVEGTNTQCSHSIYSFQTIGIFVATFPTHVCKITSVGCEPKLLVNEPPLGHVTAQPV